MSPKVYPLPQNSPGNSTESFELMRLMVPLQKQETEGGVGGVPYIWQALTLARYI